MRKDRIKLELAEDMLRDSFRFISMGRFDNAFEILTELRRYDLGKLPNDTLGRVHKQMAEVRRELGIA